MTLGYVLLALELSVIILPLVQVFSTLLANYRQRRLSTDAGPNLFGGQAGTRMWEDGWGSCGQGAATPWGNIMRLPRFRLAPHRPIRPVPSRHLQMQLLTYFKVPANPAPPLLSS